MRMTINNIALGEGSDVEACEADSHVGGCSDKMVKHENRDICGVLVPQWFGLPVQPFSVADFNSMLVPFGTPAVDGKYLCPSKANMSQVCLRLRAFFQVEEVKRWNVAQVADLAGSDDVSFFQLQYATPNSSVMTKNLDLDAFIGGAPKKHEEYPRYVIRAKCHIAPNKRGGKPSKTPLTVGNYGNRWFIMCDLDSGSILNMATMQELENNEVALTARPWRICRGFTPKWIVSYMIVLVQSYKKAPRKKPSKKFGTTSLTGFMHTNTARNAHVSHVAEMQSNDMFAQLQTLHWADQQEKPPFIKRLFSQEKNYQ